MGEERLGFVQISLKAELIRMVGRIPRCQPRLHLVDTFGALRAAIPAHRTKVTRRTDKLSRFAYGWSAPCTSPTVLTVHFGEVVAQRLHGAALAVRG